MTSAGGLIVAALPKGRLSSRGRVRKRKCHDTLVCNSLIQIQIDELPEGVFLATSDELQGLVAQLYNCGCGPRNSLRDATA